MIHNDSRLYSGGSAVFDQNPHTQLYAQLMAKKQARDEAYDQYIRSLNTKINPAGVRNADIPAFNEKLAQWQKFGMDHRDEIRNRKNGADIKFQSDFQNLQNLIERSKGTEEQKKPLIPVLIDPDKRDRAGDGLIGAIHDHDQPLYVKDKDGRWVDNPEWKPIDYGKIDFNPKPFDQNKFRELFSGIKRSEYEVPGEVDPKTLTRTVTKNAIFDKPAQDQIAQIGVTEYANNRSFKNIVDKLDPKEYNDLFKSYAGHDIQNPGDLAAAYALKSNQQSVSSQKVEPDVFAREKQMAAISNSYATKRLQLEDKLIKGRKDEKGYDTWVNDYLGTIKEQAKKGQKTLLPGADDAVYEVSLDPVMLKALNIGKGENGNTPDKLYVSEKGTYYPIYTDDKGVLDKLRSVPLTEDQMVLSLGGKTVTKGNLGKEVSGSNNVPLPKGKPKEVQQGGHTFVWDESKGEYIYKQ